MGKTPCPQLSVIDSSIGAVWSIQASAACHQFAAMVGTALCKWSRGQQTADIDALLQVIIDLARLGTFDRPNLAQLDCDQ